MKPAHCTEINAQLPHTLRAFALALVMAMPWSLPALAQDEADTPTEATEEAPASEDQASDNQPAEQPPAPPIYSSREERDMKLLASELRDQETVVWLNAIDGPFLALHEQEVGTEPVGAVLILHAEGQHSNWPTTIESIRSRLPYHGWITVATSLPNPETPALPERTLPALSVPQPAAADSDTTPAEQDTPTESPAPDETNEIFDESTQQVTDGNLAPEADTTATENTPQLAAEDVAYSRLEAAITYINDLGIFNVVLLGDGIGAARAGNFLQTLPVPEAKNPNEKPIKPIRAMVIINARNHSPIGDIKLIDSLYDPEMPILDIYFGQDQRDKIESQARKKYALRNGFQTYQQILLPELAHNTMLDSNRLTRRVRGFLQLHARGVKVDNAIIKKR